jgi:hypothetical protein
MPIEKDVYSEYSAEDISTNTQVYGLTSANVTMDDDAHIIRAPKGA